MIKIKRNCKEIEGKSFGARKSVKTGVCEFSQPQRSLCEIGTLLRNHFAADKFTAKSPLCCKTISQPQAPLCETIFGTRVPFRSTVTLISQLRSIKNSQFRSQSPISQGVLQLRNQLLAHEYHFAA